MAGKPAGLQFLISKLTELITLYGGDFPDSTDEYVGLLKFGAFEDPEPEQVENSDNLKIDFEPVINNLIENNTNIYYQPTTINIIADNNNIFPKSNLPIPGSEEQSGQTQTQISIGSPITLSEAAIAKNYGRFVYAPISPEPKEIQRIISSDFDNKFVQEIKKSMEDYINKKVKGIEIDPLDAITFLMPSTIRGNSGKMSLGIGVRPLRLLSQYYSATRANAAIGIQDEIPIEIKFSNKEISFNLESQGEEQLKINSLLSKKDIFGDTLGEEIDWFEKIREIAKEQIDPETKENIPLQAESLIDVLRNLLAVYYNKLGLEDFPLTVPTLFSQTVKDINGSEDQVEKEDLHSFIDCLFWQTQVLDGLFGKFPIDIEIEDSDLIKTGNQKLEIRLPNLAETLAELTGKILSNETSINALLAITQRSLTEAGMAKQQAIQNYYLTLANHEYLGFKTNKKIIDVDFLFNPKILNEDANKQTLDKALEPSQLPLEVDVNDDSNTLEGELAVLTEAARIIKARFFRKFNAKDDLKEQIIKKVMTSKALLDRMGEKDKEGLTSFFEAIENGFINFDPSLNPNKPYGRPHENRPKITKENTDAKNS
ncbi:MAG: hypothetical protein AB4372_10110 [Xenococcus sp. (in: cyanobacteria)]